MRAIRPLPWMGRAGRLEDRPAPEQPAAAQQSVSGEPRDHPDAAVHSAGSRQKSERALKGGEPGREQRAPPRFPESGVPPARGRLHNPPPGGLAMRAIIINAKDRTISETDIDGSLKTLQQIVGGMIEAVSQGLDESHHCYVNEEGLLDDPQHFFMFRNGHQPLAGNGVILSIHGRRRRGALHPAARLGQGMRDLHGSGSRASMVPRAFVERTRTPMTSRSFCCEPLTINNGVSP